MRDEHDGDEHEHEFVQQEEADPEEREYRRREGARATMRDRALGRLDEGEIKERMMRAFDRCVKEGFNAHLIGMRIRTANEYRLALYPDGTDTAPVDIVQEIADEWRLDFTIEKGGPELGGGWLVVLYPRW